MGRKQILTQKKISSQGKLLTSWKKGIAMGGEQFAESKLDATGGERGIKTEKRTSEGGTWHRPLNTKLKEPVQEYWTKKGGA